MKNDKIDRILADDPNLAPSSGFADSIMEAVRREAETPAPLSFPWRRVAPGLTVCLIAVGAAAIAAFTGNAGASTPRANLLDVLEGSLLLQSALWLAGSLLGSWLVVRISLAFSGFHR